ncbi:hypothetical protein JJB09_26395 [Rhizobium sp. KVB221]|uniref:Uncharacterized protein n=1 Tax=Rhizobium setariae TaxID=2801340 RepID=A0A937CRI2_9HYPH|nr:hypothetical protein [Rhizobium setariae]MBL0375533.1 hypothetical protein [Rhizobium setariae]
MAVRLLSVDDVQVSLNKSNRPTLVVMVMGRAATPGYQNIKLNVLEGELSPDHIFDLELVGDPPEGIVPQMVVPAHANLVITQDVDRIAGVIVHARTNNRTALTGPELASPPRTSSEPALGDILSRFGGLAAKFLPLGEGLTTLALGEQGFPTLAHILSEGSGPLALEKDVRSEIFRKPPGFEDFDPRERLGQRGPFGDR